METKTPDTLVETPLTNTAAVYNFGAHERKTEGKDYILQCRKTMNAEEEAIQEDVLAEIVNERNRQDQKWGIKWSLNNYAYLSILTEEVGEIAKAINEKDHFGLVLEIVQVAAVCTRWLTSLCVNSKQVRGRFQR